MFRLPYLLAAAALFASSCKSPEGSESAHVNPSNSGLEKQEIVPITLTRKQAEKLMNLPTTCVVQEYPNKLGQTLEGAQDLKEPGILHPAFYGCFDWHSAVHGHWSMVRLLKEFPDLVGAEGVRVILTTNLSAENILAEVAYFEAAYEKSYERTYGWAWVLKLQEELHNWEDPLAQELEKNLQPLANLMAQNYIDYLPKLQYPVRVGTHTNTAFGLSYAWDYAVTFKNQILQEAIRNSALAFYGTDAGCPITWEPGGADFLSPCLEEVNLMRRILNASDFDDWINHFMPELKTESFQLEPARVGDRSDGQLVHLDGLNFSRAWVFYGLANQYPETYAHLRDLANSHLAYSFPNLTGDGYEGGHWLGTFALYALGQQ
jgi:hypothetical protein